MKKSFKSGVEKYYKLHPEDKKMNGILTGAIMGLFNITTYQQYKNYMNGVTSATPQQYSQLLNIFLSYGIKDPFDD